MADPQGIPYHLCPPKCVPFVNSVKGETIGPNGSFRKPGFKNFDASDPKRIVHQDIWMSKSSRRNLPRNIDEGKLLVNG